MPSQSAIASAAQPGNPREADVAARLKDELRVVYAELSARDRELNTMTASHATQMESWVCVPRRTECSLPIADGLSS